MAGTENTKEKAKRDPETAPATVLLDAILVALNAGVPTPKIISALEFSRGATGYKAPIWRAAAKSMTDAAAAMPKDAPVAQSDVELRDGPAS